MKSVNIYIPLLLLLFSVGACGTKKSGGTSGTLTDEALLDTVQRRTFNYFWDGAEPHETGRNLVCRLLLEKKKKNPTKLLQYTAFDKAENRVTLNSL